MLQELINLPSMGIYGFINKKDLKIDLIYSSNLVTSLVQNVNSLKSSNKDVNDLEFILIEPITDIELLKVRYNYWLDYYARMGYGFYRIYASVKLKLRIEVLNDVLWPGCFDPRVYVKLVTRNRSERIVGVFTAMSEAEEFVAANYPDSSNIFNIVYANNNLTKEYLNAVRSR